MKHRQSAILGSYANLTARFHLVTLLVLSSWTVNAANLLVPANYLTIQNAINAAQPGDFIVVSTGTYTPPFINKSHLTVTDDGSGPVTITGAPTLAITGGTQVVLRNLSLDSVNLLALSGTSVNLQGIAISNGALTIATGSAAAVSNSTFSAPDDSPGMGVLLGSSLLLQGGVTVEGASGAAAVRIGPGSHLWITGTLGPNSITGNSAPALLLNQLSEASVTGDTAFTGDLIAMIHSSVSFGFPEFLPPNVVTVGVAGNVLLSEDSGFVTHAGSAVTVNGDVTCEDAESSVSLDDEFVSNGSILCTGFSNLGWRRFAHFWFSH